MSRAERYFIHPKLFPVASMTMAKYITDDYGRVILEVVKNGLNTPQECADMAAALGLYDSSIAFSDILSARKRVCDRIVALKGNNCTLDVLVAALKPSMVADLDRIGDLRERAELAPLKALGDDFALLCRNLQDCATLDQNARSCVAMAAKFLDHNVVAKGRRALLSALAHKGIFTSTLIREDVWDSVTECRHQIRNFANLRGLVSETFLSRTIISRPAAPFFTDQEEPTPPPLTSIAEDNGKVLDKDCAVVDLMAAVKNARAIGVDATRLVAAFNLAMK